MNYTAKGLRAALYARYSTDKQNERSIDDQLALLRDLAKRHGWRIVDEATPPTRRPRSPSARISTDC
jgi:DNA invertase Pin-like site-specific DNA recombinase